ncbi:unnamed protein product, partial [Closterium sp. NIES-53]
MARSRKSRKGKKEWRRNISTADHDKFLEEKGREERSGGALDAVPSENIFFVDKSKAENGFFVDGSSPLIPPTFSPLFPDYPLLRQPPFPRHRSPLSPPVAPKLRKVDKWRARESHADAILKRSSLVPPLVPEPTRSSPARAKSNAKPWEKPADTAAEGLASAEAPAAGDGGGKGGGGAAGGIEDGGGGEIVVAASGEGPMAIVQNLAGNRRAVRATDKATSEGAGGEVGERVRRRGDGKMIGGKEDRSKAGSSIPAVEIDAPGCSFNPSVEEHQDAIAVAVAEELKESYQAVLAPTPPQLMVSRAEEEEARMQEAADFFLTQEEADEEEEEEEDEDGNTAAVTKHRVPKRLTRADLNRRMRHKLVEAELAKRRKLKVMRKDLDRLKELQRELEEEREEAEKRRVRREIARVELRMKRAPRLGRHKFKPEPMSVLTSDQVTGSLRQLKGSFTLVRDRFKSFQKRGLIETHGPT